MKALRYIIVLIVAVLAGCRSEVTVENLYLRFSTDNLSFVSKGGEQNIEVYCNAEWNIVSDLPEWLDIVTVSEEGDRTVLAFELTRNSDEAARMYEVRFEYPEGSGVVSITQSGSEFLEFAGDENVSLEENDTVVVLGISKNVPYNIYIDSNRGWIDIEGYNEPSPSQMVKEFTEKQIVLNIEGNTTGEVREAEIVISNRKYGLADTVVIAQKSGEKRFYNDGDYFRIQKGQTDNPVNIIIMGDGFVAEDMEIGGEYERVMREAAEHFFSIEPYSTYRGFFSVYAVIAQSETDRVGGGQTKFQTRFGQGTAISCNDGIVFEYAEKVKEIPQNSVSTVIVPMNINKYAGTAYLYSDGNSIALCPMSDEQPPNDFEGLIHHEAGGHAFGFLCDEYVYYDEFMPESRKLQIQEWQKLGFHQNLDFTDNTDEIRWKDFVGKVKYGGVGAYEGGYEYQYGVWRPEMNSCMNNNVPYYNVQSRWTIVSRIMEMTGTDFSISEFIRNDIGSDKVHSRSIDGMTGFFVPLGEPVLIRK